MNEWGFAHCWWILIPSDCHIFLKVHIIKSNLKCWGKVTLQLFLFILPEIIMSSVKNWNSIFKSWKFLITFLAIDLWLLILYNIVGHLFSVSLKLVSFTSFVLSSSWNHFYISVTFYNHVPYMSVFCKTSIFYEPMFGTGYNYIISLRCLLPFSMNFFKIFGQSELYL